MITGNNHYFNQPALAALESLTGPGTIPDDIAAQILDADPHDDLSGLRLFASRLRDPDYWTDVMHVTQPKAQIGEYVEAHGIRVPKRYGSADEAMHAVNNGHTVIARSENPDEYDGPSGLMQSHVMSWRRIGAGHTEFAKAHTKSADISETLERLTWENMQKKPVQRYMDITRTDFEDFEAKSSYSFWELVPGRNVTVIADDAIAGRYHVLSVRIDEDGYQQLDSGAATVIDVNSKLEPVIDVQGTAGLSQPELANLLVHYEAVRNLPAFSPGQCPVMEWQISDGKEGNTGELYFLQYHKARESSPAPDPLNLDEYPASEGWVRAQGVRGALGACVLLNTALWYPEHFGNYQADYGGTKSDMHLPDIEDASFDYHYDVGLSEILSRRRTAYLAVHGIEDLYRGMAVRHDNRSRWFKPMAGISLGRAASGELIPKEIKDHVSDWVHRRHGMKRVALDAASDGRVGFVRLNPDAEQPVSTRN